MSRLKFLSCVILSSFVAISAAYAEGEEAIPAQTEPESLQDVVTGNTPTEATITSTGVCGENLFNPQLLSESDFNVTISNGTMSAVGKWNQYVNAYVSAYNFGFKPGKKYKVTYTIKCDDTETGTHFLGLKLADNTVVGPANVCAGQTGDKLVSYWYESSALNPVVGMVAGGEASEEEITLQNVMVTEAEMSTSSYIPYLACIRVASSLNTTNRAAVVENRLNDVRSVITNLIGQMETNTTNILSLNNTKQTRPAAACADGKKCLLVKDTSGGNHWYEIQDCSVMGFFEDVENWTQQASSPTNSVASFNDVECTSSNQAVGCSVANNELMGSWSAGIIFSEYKKVAISETGSGHIVELPAGITSGQGNACVCRVTGYRAKSGNEYDERVDITTDKWVVAGPVAYGDNCEAQCMRYMVGNGAGQNSEYVTQIKNYYANISNSCSVDASEVTACQYNDFIAMLVSNGAVHDEQGGVRMRNGQPYGGWACQQADAQNNIEAGALANNPHCAVNANNVGSWITEFKSNDGNNTDYGYVYGIGGYVNVQDAQIADVIDMQASNIHRTSQSGDNAVVCMVQGYKPANGSEQTLSVNKAIVYSLDATVTAGNDNAAVACSEWLSGTAANYSTGANKLYSILANYCSTSNQ